MPQLALKGFALNIRQKVLLGMAVAILGFSLLGGISYRHLLGLEQALGQAEVVDDLFNDILEVRRYEKNYLLYALRDDYRESLEYVRKTLGLIARLESPDGSDMNPVAASLTIQRLRSQLQGYEEAFTRLAGLDQADRAAENLRGNLRERGKQLVDTAQSIVSTQRHSILASVKRLKLQLIFSILALGGISLLIAWTVGRRIIAALKLIDVSTRQIAHGDFTPLPVPEIRDETQGVALALNRMVTELEKRQGQLLQEKKLASLGVLTSGIAHQLNNPLNNISTSCQILREEAENCDPGFARQMLDNIYHEVIRSRDIVKGLLEFSRETRFTLKPAPLAELAERAARLVASHLPAGVSLIREVPPDLAACIDVQRMQEALLNLLINAAESIDRPEGVITISGRSDEAAGQAVLTVRDTGMGIAPEHLGRIFDPFFTLKEVGKGTGLGLSVVFGIVKKHGGAVCVESEPGRGTTFTIRLPLASGADDPAGLPTPGGEAA